MPGSGKTSWHKGENTSAPAASTALNIAQVQTNAGGTGTLNLSFTSLPACTLVFLIPQENDTSVLPGSASLSGGGLTYTKGADSGATGSANAEIWTAPFSGGNVNVTITWGTNPFCAAGIAVVNVEGTLGGASNTQTGATNPSVNLTTTRNGSFVFAVTSDLFANDGANRVYRSNPTELYYLFLSTFFTGYCYVLYVPTITTVTMGLTAPSMGAGGGTAVLEIRTA